MKFKRYLTENKLLLESFDKPYNKKEIDISDEERNDIKKNHNIEDYREYHIDVPDTKDKHRMTVYRRKGAYEIHHDIIKDGSNNSISGKMIGDKPNPRYIATMLHHAKHLLDNSHSVRIVGHKENGMFEHYHRIGKILAKKHNYNISEPISFKNTSNNDAADDFNEYTISKKMNTDITNINLKSLIKDNSKTGLVILNALNRLDILGTVYTTIIESECICCTENKNLIISSQINHLHLPLVEVHRIKSNYILKQLLNKD